MEKTLQMTASLPLDWGTSRISISATSSDNKVVTLISFSVQCLFLCLTHKQLETHRCVLSTVATNAMVLKHQAICIHYADYLFVVLDKFHIRISYLKGKHWKMKWPFKKQSKSFAPCDLEVCQMTLKTIGQLFYATLNFVHHSVAIRGFELELQSRCVQFGSKLVFLSQMTLKFDRWPWKTIGHLFPATSSFVHHFVAIYEFKFELQFRNAQIGVKFVLTYVTLTFDLDLLHGSYVNWPPTPPHPTPPHPTLKKKRVCSQNLSCIQSAVCLQMHGNCLIKQRLWNNRGSAEYHHKLIWPERAANEFAHQIWAQSKQ